MAIEELIFARLDGFAGLTALVADRVYVGILPQDVALPAVSWRRVTGDRLRAMVADPGLVRARFQFDAWAETYLAARDVREQLRLALERWSDAGPPAVQATFFLSEIDLYEDDTELHHLSCDYEINYEE
jgi:hypothetical protein